jgi:hypothetical protein
LLRAGIAKGDAFTQRFLPIYIDMSVLDWDVGPLREVREGFAHALPDDDHWAKGDIFTHAFLYDLEALREDLARATILGPGK